MSLRLSSRSAQSRFLRPLSSRALSTTTPPIANQPTRATTKPKPATTPILDTIMKVISAGNGAERPSAPPPQSSARPPMSKWDPASFDPSRASAVSPGDFSADALLRNSGGGRAGGAGALDQARAEWNKQLLSVAGRRWREGDLYAPRDLGPREAAKWSFATTRIRMDPFRMMGRNPLSFYKVRSQVCEISG
jgi:hypothetical protein